MSARACRCDRPSPPAALQQRAARRARRVSARAGGSAWGPMIGQQAGTDKGLCLPDTISYLGVFPVAFIPFMLCERLTDPARLQDRRYIAEAKLDGQRAQLHIRQGRTIACYSRRGLDLLRHAGMAWLREMTWPVASAVFDGEAVAGDGHEGIQTVFAERDKPGGAMAFMAFDVLELDSRRVLREPWRDRRKRLEAGEPVSTGSSGSPPGGDGRAPRPSCGRVARGRETSAPATPGPRDRASGRAPRARSAS